MSSEIEGHITRKYEIKKRLGKGVSLNWNRFHIRIGKRSVYTRRVVHTAGPIIWVGKRIRVIWISSHLRFLCVYFDPKNSKGKSSAKLKAASVWPFNARSKVPIHDESGAGVKCEVRVCEVVKCEVRCEVGCDWSVASGSPRTYPT